MDIPVAVLLTAENPTVASPSMPPPITRTVTSTLPTSSRTSELATLSPILVPGWYRYTHDTSGGGRHFRFGGLAQLARMRKKFYATLCPVLRKRSRGTLDNVQHALVTTLKARGRDTILV